MQNKFSHICTGVFCHWETNLELAFIDTKGNMFDENGKLLSKEVENSWWLYPNNRTKWSKFIGWIDIYKDIIIWKFKRWFYFYN